MIFTLNLLGHTLCLALPAAAAAASPLWLYGCLTAIGEQDHLPTFFLPRVGKLVMRLCTFIISPRE